MKKYKLIKEYPESPIIGTISWEKDSSMVYNSPSKGVYYSSKIIEYDNYKEFWEEIVEKEYEILSFISGGRILKCQQKSQYLFFHYIDDKDFNVKPYIGRTCEELLKSSLYSIHSIKRLSDGEVFTIYDKIETNYKGYLKHTIIIKSIELVNFKLVINTLTIHDYDDNTTNTRNHTVLLKNIKKQKSPLFTTEDGIDIFETKIACEVAIKAGEESTMESEDEWVEFDIRPNWPYDSFNEKLFYDTTHYE